MDGAVYFMDRLKSGDFWTAASLCFATVSRIWYLYLIIFTIVKFNYPRRKINIMEYQISTVVIF